MRLKWKIGLLAGAAVLALGGGTIISATQDADWLKTRLADAVESSTGRHLSIGQLHVWILPFPWVEAKDVKLSSVAEDGVNMLDIGQVRARLALLPLFSHRIAFEDVSLISHRCSCAVWQMGGQTGISHRRNVRAASGALRLPVPARCTGI